MTTVDSTRLVKAYLKIRDERKKLSQEFDEKDNLLKEKAAKLEAVMLATLNNTGADSLKTPAGTFYKQEEIIPSGSDWGAFFAWVKEYDAFDALERRIKKTFVKDHMAQHNGAPPPGVSVFREWVVRVRRGD